MATDTSGITQVKIFSEPPVKVAPLIVTWMPDAGKVGSGVSQYLVQKLGGFVFAEVEPVGFFPLDGVVVQDDVAQFPETKFYFCPRKDLIIVSSSLPRLEWYAFLTTILNGVEKVCKVKEMYIIGGMASASAHTSPRALLSVASSSQTKDIIGPYDVVKDMEYETPEDQRPTLNAFLLWTAQQRGIPAVNLWVQVPFYLVAREDPQAWKRILDFLNQRLELGVDSIELDSMIARQNQKIARARIASPELDRCLTRLESNLGLSTSESESLIRMMEELLDERDQPGNFS